MGRLARFIRFFTDEDEGGKPRPTPVYKTAKGAIVHIKDALAAPVKELVVQIDPVQDLHGYANPWPAGGGKNIVSDGTDTNNGYISGYYIGASGTTIAASADRVTEYFEVEAETDYTWSGVPTSWNSPGICFYDQNKDYISGIAYAKKASYTFTTPSGAKYARASDQMTPCVMIVLGSIASAFEPYSNICPITGWTGCNISHSGEDTSDPTVIPISWQSSAGTVYGGTVDVTSGVLTVTMAEVVFDGSIVESDFDYASLDTGVRIKWKEYDNIGVANAVFQSDTLKMANRLDRPGEWEMAANSTKPRMFIGVPDTISSLSAFKAYCTNNPISVVYPLATPQTYQLTPEEVTTLLGQNNIWADTYRSGNQEGTTVTYLADGETSDEEAANILLGGAYRNGGEEDEASDNEAVNILLGGGT